MSYLVEGFEDEVRTTGIQFDPWLTLHGEDCIQSEQHFTFTGMKLFLTCLLPYIYISVQHQYVILRCEFHVHKYTEYEKLKKKGTANVFRLYYDMKSLLLFVIKV